MVVYHNIPIFVYYYYYCEHWWY